MQVTRIRSHASTHLKYISVDIIFYFIAEIVLPVFRGFENCQFFAGFFGLSRPSHGN